MNEDIQAIVGQQVVKAPAPVVASAVDVEKQTLIAIKKDKIVKKVEKIREEVSHGED